MRALIPLSLLCVPLLAGPASDVLLGVVPLEEGGKVVVAHVLEKSPAEKAKLQKGDELLEVNGKKVAHAADVGSALAGAREKDRVEVVFRRDGKEQTAAVKLVARDRYRGDFLKAVPRGKTGFEAPDWHIQDWSGLKEGQAAPTRENTKGKVVVFHCFQSW